MGSDRAPGSALRWVGAVLIGLGGGAVAALAAAELLAPAAGGAAGLLGGASPQAIWAPLGAAPFAGVALVAAPLVAAVLAALLVGSGRRGAAAAGRGVARTSPAVASEPAAAGRAAEEGEAALRLLALLQQEGRFVDFIEEEIASYSDDQIGAAVRPIHEGCRAVLRERLDLAPVLAGSEGARVTVERGFDPGSVRVTGNVRGEPPYEGVLRHPGWRSTGLRLPERRRGDASILAPAEVEVL